MGCLLALTDDLLAELLVRAPSPADLARASASCASLRRVATSPRFLRRFRSLHAPPPLGVFFPDAAAAAFYPALPPNPTAPAARALALAADFSFAFLPCPSPEREWLVRDHRDGRFLLDRAAPSCSTTFTEVAVCDPLFRRYILLPPIPDDLAATVDNPYLQRGGDGEPGLQSRSNEIFLASRAGNDDDLSQLPFAVIWMACCRGKLVAFCFCSESRLWRALSPPVHHALSMRRVMGVRLGQRNNAHGCFYWMITLTRRWLVLDTRRNMEFSILDISPVLLGRTMMFSNQITTLESEEGTTTVVVSDLFRADKRCVLYFYTFMSFGDRWRLQHKITLPEEWGDRFRGITGAFQERLFIKLDHPKENLGDPVEQNVTYYWFDIKTMRLGRFTEISSATVNEAYLCTGFAPSLSLPSV